MWERAELKANAKAALSRFYWPAVLVCFVYGLLGGAGGSGGSVANLSSQINRASSSGGNYNYGYDYGYGSTGAEFQQFLLILMPILLVAIVIAVVLSLAMTIFVLGPLQVGVCRYFMESRTFKSDFTTLFYGFKGGRYLKNVKVMALMTVKIWLWSLLFVIPGIIKSYEYYMIPYLLAENADLETDRYFQISQQMTDGEKADIFVLGLSFLGWILLGALLCGIGTIFVSPYIRATDAELYALMRAKAFATNIASPDELRDFRPPMI